MKNQQRSMRRHHLQRLKNARKTNLNIPEDKLSDPVFLGRHLTTPTPCSCVRCGNLRRHTGEKTLQEQIWYTKAQYELTNDTIADPDS